MDQQQHFISNRFEGGGGLGAVAGRLSRDDRRGEAAAE